MHDTCKKVGKVPWPPCLQRNRKARHAAGGSIKRYANKRRLCVILVRGIRATARIIAHLLSPPPPRAQITGNSSTEVRRKRDVTYVVAFIGVIIVFVRPD